MDGASHVFGLVDAFAAEALTGLLARLEVHREHPVAVEVWAATPGRVARTGAAALLHPRGLRWWRGVQCRDGSGR